MAPDVLTGSPFLNGTLDLHKELEHKIAEYIGKEDVMIYSTKLRSESRSGVGADRP